MKEIKSEAKLTFWEATSIIIGHGVGSGILAVPFIASRNSIIEIICIIMCAYLVNLFMHLMIAELCYNNKGAQLIKCIEGELFSGIVKKIISWAAFILLGFSVFVNVSGFIVGASDVFQSWLGLNATASIIIYYILAASVVLFGMKLVGICEKYSVIGMLGVMIILLFASINHGNYDYVSSHIAVTNWIILYSIVSFSLSAVMSVPQVVKGLEGDIKHIRLSIALGIGINVGLIAIVTAATLIGAGSHITTRGALVDLSEQLGGWVSIIGYVFSILALSTSFWANTLNLRDVINEQTKLGIKSSWFIATFPCLIIALIGIGTFVGFVRLASVVQILTGIGVIVSYNRSRKRNSESPICGLFGSLPFQIIVVVSSVVATVGALFHVL